MAFSDTSTDFIVCAAITAPATGSAPVSLRGLLSAGDLAAVDVGQSVQVEMVPESIDVQLRDSIDTAGRPDDFFTMIAKQSTIVSVVKSLDKLFVVSSAAAAKVRLLIHCRQF
jgi:hypothetical protein